MWNDGRPRYWVGWWDTPHLALPVVTLALLVWLALQPRPSQPPVVRPRDANPVAAGNSGSQAQAPRAMAPPIVDTPTTGSRLRAPAPGQLMAEVRGRSMEANLRAVLFYSSPGRAEAALTETTTDSAGRFRFGLGPFPQGTYTLRVATYAPDGRRAVSAPFQISVTAR